MPFFEALMLICFGAAWPLSILKSFRSRRNDGKSLFFLLVILLGYVSGIIYKTSNPNLVIVLYIINALMVTIDLGLYYRNALLSKSNA
jgi:hypothetical protein